MTFQEALSGSIEYEHRVRDHYLAAADKVTDPQGKKIFATLAREEQGHVDYLESRLGEWKRTGAITETELSTLLPPTAWIAGEARKLAGGATPGPSSSSPELDLLKTALELERTTSAFYEGLVGGLDPKHRPLFARFLEIERGHVLIVQAEIDSLAGHGHWFDFMEFTLEGA